MNVSFNVFSKAPSSDVFNQNSNASNKTSLPNFDPKIEIKTGEAELQQLGDEAKKND